MLHIYFRSTLYLVQVMCHGIKGQEFSIFVVKILIGNLQLTYIYDIFNLNFKIL